MFKKFIFILFFSFYFSLAYADVTIGTVVHDDTLSGGGGNELSVSCDSGSGSNRVLYAFIGQRDASVSTFTYAGNSLTEISNLFVSSATSLQAYRIINPTSGSNTLSLAFVSAPSHAVLICVPMSGVDQTTPNDSVSTNTGTSSPITHSITSGLGDLVLGFGFTSHSAGGGTITANQTSVYDLDGLFIGAKSAGIGTTPGDGASKTISFNVNVPLDWGEIIFNINAAGGGGSPIVRRHRQVIQ